jgi:hypothetical protein
MYVLEQILAWVLALGALLALLGFGAYGVWVALGWISRPPGRPLRALTGAGYLVAAVLALLVAAALGALVQLMLIGRG